MWQSAYAADLLGGPLVPQCTGPFEGACQLCDLLTLLQNLLNFAIGFSILVATGMFVYAGILYFTAAAKQDNIKKAHGIFTKVFIGLIFVLGAWLIIDLVLSTLTGKGIGPWVKVDCAAWPAGSGGTPVGTPGSGSGNGGVTGSGGTSGSCPDCTSMDSSVPQKPGIGGSVDKDLNPKLKDADLNSMGLRVTENYPPQVSHQAQCHKVGTCVDVNKADGSPSSAGEIKTAVTKFSQSGLRAVYEVKTTQRKNELIAQGVPASSVTVVPTIKAEHYSVYCDTCGG